jgi:hypothetical protein
MTHPARCRTVLIAGLLAIPLASVLSQSTQQTAGSREEQLATIERDQNAISKRLRELSRAPGDHRAEIEQLLVARSSANEQRAALIGIVQSAESPQARTARIAASARALEGMSARQRAAIEAREALASELKTLVQAVANDPARRVELLTRWHQENASRIAAADAKGEEAAAEAKALAAAKPGRPIGPSQLSPAVAALEAAREESLKELSALSEKAVIATKEQKRAAIEEWSAEHLPKIKTLSEAARAAAQSP